MENLLERRSVLKCRIAKLNRTLQTDLAIAFEKHFEARADTYFRMEEQLYNFESLLKNIDGQSDQAKTCTDLNRTADRLSYVEDRLDEFQSTLYRRPRRRHANRLNLFDFLNRFHQGEKSSASSGIHSLRDAYGLLGLEQGAAFSKVTTAFRYFAKNYHPDAHGGDRSNESKLRLVMEAYQFIKRSQ